MDDNIIKHYSNEDTFQISMEELGGMYKLTLTEIWSDDAEYRVGGQTELSGLHFWLYSDYGLDLKFKSWRLYAVIVSNRSLRKPGKRYLKAGALNCQQCYLEM